MCLRVARLSFPTLSSFVSIACCHTTLFFLLPFHIPFLSLSPLSLILCLLFTWDCCKNIKTHTERNINIFIQEHFIWLYWLRLDDDDSIRSGLIFSLLCWFFFLFFFFFLISFHLNVCSHFNLFKVNLRKIYFNFDQHHSISSRYPAHVNPMGYFIFQSDFRRIIALLSEFFDNWNTNEARNIATTDFTMNTVRMIRLQFPLHYIVYALILKSVISSYCEDSSLSGFHSFAAQLVK